MISPLLLAATAALSVRAASLSARDDSTDFSKFDTDSRLHRSLWGMAYTPQNSSNYPTCGDTIEEVARDVQLMSQLTTRLRTYGSDCQQTELVLDAIKRTKTNLHVYVGLYLDGMDETFQRQQKTLFDVLDKFGVDNILGITVGNEYILGQATENAANRDTAEQYVIARIADVRTTLAGKKYNKTIPVGTADAGSQITAALSQAADYVMANTHAFFSGVNIEGAADWTAQFLVNDAPHFATDAKKTLISAEVGWPTDAMAGGSLTLNGSVASLQNTQMFLDTFVCAANKNITNGDPTGVGYFYFELFDEEWKRSFGGAEPYWGLFDSSRNLKNLKIPDCEAPGETALAGTGTNSGTGSNSGSGSSSNSSSSGNDHSGASSIHAARGAWVAAAGAAVLGAAMFL